MHSQTGLRRDDRATRKSPDRCVIRMGAAKHHEDFIRTTRLRRQPQPSYHVDAGESELAFDFILGELFIARDGGKATSVRTALCLMNPSHVFGLVHRHYDNSKPVFS
jgi:hypothetical protein